MSGVYLKRAGSIERGDIVLMSGTTLHADRVVDTVRIGSGSSEIMELRLERGPIGFLINTVLCCLDAQTPWPPALP